MSQKLPKKLGTLSPLFLFFRYLAEGVLLKAILLGYRKGHSSVQSIVTETCGAIVEDFMNEVMPELY